MANPPFTCPPSAHPAPSLVPPSSLVHKLNYMPGHQLGFVAHMCKSMRLIVS